MLPVLLSFMTCVFERLLYDAHASKLGEHEQQSRVCSGNLDFMIEVLCQSVLCV